MGDRVEISGSVERITYYNEENGYTVLRLRPDTRGMLPYVHGEPLATVVGNLPEVNPGEWLKLTGQWLNHAKHGRQFQVELCEQSVPASVEGIKRYLGSGMVRGVGKVMAERIVNRFGAETLDIIDENPQRLGEVLGIGRKRVDNIIRAWEEQRAIKDVMVFLHGHGISTHLAVKIYKQYGDQSLAVVQTTPYRLVQDVHGIGFKTADKIAQALGLAADDPARIEAGIHYTLSKMAEDGHVYAPQDELEPEAADILQVPAERVSAVLESLENSELVRRETITYQTADDRRQTAEHSSPVAVREERAVYLPALYFSETGLTRQVRRLVEHPTSRLTGVTASSLAAVGGRPSAVNSLTAQQRQAITATLSHKLTILTGGPGTGKTTTLRTLLDTLDATGHTYTLASPTGRAAKRLTEATGREAKTIHRLLEFKPGEGFGRNENNPIDADLIVIDEASMLDLVLAYNLLRAIGSDSHLLLVGDIDQLPSVGAGDVLRDLIASDVAAVVRLETIFRQAANSLIIRNAHRINQGLMPETTADGTGDGISDFYLFIKEDPAETADLLVDIVAKRVPQKFGFDPLDDIQVLAPMYNGLAGVTQLNVRLQEALNPPGRGKVERRIGGRAFRVGDKVMQTVNNYDKSVYNGDIGRITAIDVIEQILTVAIDGAPVVYSFLEADELIHAFAVSVHKAQGSEYPCVVIPVVVQHYMMLQRNLLYTAVTRARRLAILVGTRRAIQIAVRTNPTANRHTALDWRLKQ